MLTHRKDPDVYTFALRRPGREDVQIPHAVEELILEADGDLLRVRASWCRSRVERARHAADRPLLHTWPGVDELVMYQSGLDPDVAPVEVFVGTVVRVEYGTAMITLTAEQSTLQPMQVTTAPGTDGDLSVQILVDNDNRPVTVDLGDSTSQINLGNGLTPTAHTYAEAGTYTVTVVDMEDATRNTTAEVTVPWE